MSKKKLNLLIVGFGQWARSSLDLFESDDVSNKIEKIGVVSSKNEKDIKILTNGATIYVYNSLDQALNEFNPNAIFIATPDHVHLSYLKEIFSKHDVNKLSILIEKPFHINYCDSVDFLELNGFKKEQGIFKPDKIVPFIMVDWHKKYSNQNKFFNLMISQKQELGDLRTIRVEFLDKKKVMTDKFISWCDKTDIFSFLAGHFFDLIYQSLPNFIPKMITANAVECNAVVVESHIQLVLKNKINKKTILCNFIISCNEPDTSYALTEQNITYIFENARIKIDTTGKDFELIDTTGVNYINANSRFSMRDPWTHKKTAIGYTFESQLRWIEETYNILNNFSTIQESFKKYPLSLLPEATISACKESLARGHKVNDAILGIPIKIRL